MNGGEAASIVFPIWRVNALALGPARGQTGWVEVDAGGTVGLQFADLTVVTFRIVDAIVGQRHALTKGVARGLARRVGVDAIGTLLFDDALAALGALIVGKALGCLLRALPAGYADVRAGSPGDASLRRTAVVGDLAGLGKTAVILVVAADSHRLAGARLTGGKAEGATGAGDGCDTLLICAAIFVAPAFARLRRGFAHITDADLILSAITVGIAAPRCGRLHFAFPEAGASGTTPVTVTGRVGEPFAIQRDGAGLFFGSRNTVDLVVATDRQQQRASGKENRQFPKRLHGVPPTISKIKMR